MNLSFRLGLSFGVILYSFALLYVYYFISILREEKMMKFLQERKLLQSYADWKIAQKKKKKRFVL